MATQKKSPESGAKSKSKSSSRNIRDSTLSDEQSGRVKGGRINIGGGSDPEEEDPLIP